jgi:hypothetical protein
MLKSADPGGLTAIGAFIIEIRPIFKIADFHSDCWIGGTRIFWRRSVMVLLLLLLAS